MKTYLPKIMLCFLLVLLALVSFFLVAEYFSSLDIYRDVLDSIDKKAGMVLTLSSSSALSSTAISLLPGDAAMPLANELMDLSGYFLLILSVLYAEKYILALLGMAVFRCVIPFTCAAGFVAVICSSKKLRNFAVKVTVFALMLLLIIPLCMKVSDIVYISSEESLLKTAESANELADSAANAEEKKGSFIDTIVDTISGTVSSLTAKAIELITDFVESIAVLLVTTCVIPLLSLLLFLWMIKTFVGLNILPAFKAFNGKQNDRAADNMNDEELAVH